MNRIALALLASIALSFASCVKKDYELPPDTSNDDPMLPVSHTIEELKALNGVFDYRTGGDTTLITRDVVISGVVTANDKSGNIYQAIYIEDSTGGLKVAIDAFSLYNDYPVGRKIYIRCKGLMLGYDAGTPALGRGVSEQFQVEGMTGSQIFNQIVKGPVNQPLTPPEITLTEAVDNFDDYVNRLVTIKDVQFEDSLGNLGYAQPNGNTNREISDCASNKTLDVRTSNYASFFSAKLPQGNGKMTGILTVFKSSFNGSASPQLTLRDTSDVKLTGLRCGGGTGNTGTVLLSESFNIPTTGVVALTGWMNVAVAGTQKWTHSNAGSSSNPYARISAFQTSEPVVESWLVTPSIDLAGAVNPVLTFRSANGFDNGATLKVYATTNFTGDVTTTSWTQLSPTLAPPSATGFSSFTSSGNISLSAFLATGVRIAWRYEGGDPASGTDKTTTWEIDDVKVIKN